MLLGCCRSRVVWFFTRKISNERREKIKTRSLVVVLHACWIHYCMIHQ